MENNKQLAITRQPCFVTIGSNAVREVTDFHINYVALERLLGRIASHKPEAMRQLRNQNIDRYRFEIDIGAILFDFCETAHITIAHQKIIGQYKYGYCTAERLLIEVDEKQHQYLLSQRRIDKLKDELAKAHGYKLLRISVPCTNVAKLCGTIASELVIISQLGLNSVQTS